MSSHTTNEVFFTGKYTVKLISIHQEDIDSNDSSLTFPPPPKPLLISSPCDEGEFPVCVFLHGFLLHNSFYSQLIQHISSHGFIVVAPQLYTIAGCDCTKEISDTAKTTDWLMDGLAKILPNHVQPNLSKLAIAGHSRGGKDAFALALGRGAKTSLPFSALLAVDPVGGTSKQCQTTPHIINVTNSFELNIPVLVIGSRLGELKKNCMFPPCAPKGVNHQEFFDQSKSPIACHLVARDYGHMDTLNDDTKGIKGVVSYCICVNGEKREPMRNFVGGVMVAFMKAYLKGEKEDLWDLRDHQQVAIPIVLSEAVFQLE